MAKEKSQAEKDAIMAKWQERATLKAIQALLPQGLTIKSHTPVLKEVRKKSAHYPEVYTTIWCRNEQKESVLVLYDGHKIKMISEQELSENYVVRTVKKAA